MDKFTGDIERNMNFLMSSDLKKSLSHEEAISHLAKARNLLANAGLMSYSSMVNSIIHRAQTIDDCDIEVKGDL